MTPPPVRSRFDDSRWLAVVFGDRIGLCVFLVGVLFLALTWRVGFFIVDSRTVANLAASVAGGSLAVVDMPYSLTVGAQPGLVEVGGNYFGRNYGQVYLSVPFVWGFDALESVVPARLLLAGGWSLGVVALGRTAGRVFGRPTLSLAGSLAGVAATAIAVGVLTPVDRFDQPAALLGLQVTSLLVAAAGGTVLYRLLGRLEGTSVAAAGGFGFVLATPIGFWGTIPKRHVFTATLLLLVCLGFAHSRDATDRTRTVGRAVAYGAIGLLASIHAFEAAFVFAVLVPFDVAVHRQATLRSHALVGAVFLVAVTPMLVTNLAIAGDPLGVPRTLPDATAGSTGIPNADVTPETVGGTAGDSTPAVGADGPVGILEPLMGLVATLLWIARYMLDAVVAGLATLQRPQALFHTFVRSGWIPGVRYAVNGWEAVELSMFEAFPLAAPVISAPLLLGADRRNRWREWDVHAVDGLAAGMAAVFVLVYLPRLPLHSMITLRYVVPAMGLVLYLVCRLPPITVALSSHARTTGLAYAVTVGAGGLVFVVAGVSIDPATGEAIQLHGLVGLSAALATAIAVASTTVGGTVRAVAAVLGIAGGATTLFLLSASLWQLQYAPYALDLARLLAESLPPIG
jgi:hypothetical protein